MEKSNIYLKELILAAIAVAASIAVFWLWSGRVAVVQGTDIRGYSALILPIAGICLSGAFFAFAMLFVRNVRIAYLSAGLSVGTPYLLLPASSVVFGTFVLSIFLILFSARRMRSEYALSNGFSISKIAREGLPLYFTVASLVISVFYLHQLNQQNGAEALIPRPALDYTLRWLTKNPSLFESLDVPAINPDMSIDEVLKNFLQKELEDAGGVNKIPEQELSRLILEQRTVLSRQYGISLRGNEKVGDVLNHAVQSYMARLLGPYQEYLPFASAAAFFLAFKTLTLPLYYVTLLLSNILIKLAFYGKILKREKEKIEVERVMLA
ncbi:MAG: hypothetical protein HYT37_02070 [Candidatus Sungbacteria bacterium]|nr:hypothetical protein [Candidatus Sungbacteria bacterium]